MINPFTLYRDRALLFRCVLLATLLGLASIADGQRERGRLQAGSTPAPRTQGLTTDD